MKQKIHILKNRIFWRVFLDLWTITALIVSTIDFFSKNQYNSATGVANTIYIAVLGFYAADKEIMRWTKRLTTRFLGETYIGVWTILLLVLIVVQISTSTYQISSQMTATYISVVGIFAITRNSKTIYKTRLKNKS